MKPTGAVKVIHGANDDVFEGIGGTPVRQVHRNLSDAFNLPPDSVAFVNGASVEPSYRVQPNDTLEFCKRDGRKGVIRLYSLEQVEKEYGLPAEMCHQLAGCLIPFTVNRNGESLYLESAIDDWIESRATGMSRTEMAQRIVTDLRRIADRLDPPPPDKVGTPYVSGRLGCTTVWITELIRKKEIPPNCIVPGTGNGKPWKFYRERIDRWIKDR